MRRALPWIWGVAGLVLLAVLWELYRALGPDDGWVVGAVAGETGSGLRLLPRSDDRSMPSLLAIGGRLLESSAGGDTPPLWTSVLSAVGVTLGIAALGWAIALLVGFLLALAMQRWRIAEWAILPWVVVSQTVPLIAFAPVVNTIGNQIDRGGFPWPQWLSVAIVASYLAFFPIAVGVLRGLNAPDAIHVELMRSYAASSGQTLWKLRLPASVPHLLPALRLAAASAVVGAVVAEVSIGMGGGVGRMIFQLAGQATSDPEAPFASTLGAVLLGLIAAGVVALIGAGLKNYRRGEVTA